MERINVLAIDGGGIRGIIPAVILDVLQQRLGRDLYNCFDLIAGTSTGGIIALALGTPCNGGRPYAPGDLVDLYVRNGPAIFRKTILTPLRQFCGPKYSPRPLEAALATFFGSAEFDTALTPLLISSYDLRRQLPFFFKSHKIGTSRDYNWPLVSIARATSAAPTFFPPLHLRRGSDEYALVDGGVYVNNPAMAAYAEARALYGKAAEFVIVSVGTGNRQDRITFAEARRWGLLQWARQIVPVFMDSVSEAVDYELAEMPACVYHRLQVDKLSSSANDMDNVAPENLATLQRTARDYVATASDAIQAICADIGRGRGSDMPGIGRRPGP